LKEEFLDPMDISRYRLAKEINVPQRRIDEIVSGDSAITADTALRLSRYFGLSDTFWLNLQVDYDARTTKSAMAKTLDAIKPIRKPSAGSGSSAGTLGVLKRSGNVIKNGGVKQPAINRAAAAKRRA
jgi:addiction module HigA family antidote